MGHVVIEPAKLAAAYRYANTLRNKPKRYYASAYIGWLRNGAEGLEPERGRLSPMAAQAVRINVNAMCLWVASEINRYRNPWHKPHSTDYGPKFYTTSVKPVEYRGFLIFERIKGCSWELVKDGVCLTQRAGRNGPRKLVDALLGDPADESPFNVERARAIAAQFNVTIPSKVSA